MRKLGEDNLPNIVIWGHYVLAKGVWLTVFSKDNKPDSQSRIILIVNWENLGKKPPQVAKVALRTEYLVAIKILLRVDNFIISQHC